MLTGRRHSRWLGAGEFPLSRTSWRGAGTAVPAVVRGWNSPYAAKDQPVSVRREYALACLMGRGVGKRGKSAQMSPPDEGGGGRCSEMLPPLCAYGTMP